MAAVTEEVATVLRHLPADGTLEDVQYGLYVLEKVKRGLADVEAGRTLTQEEVEQRFSPFCLYGCYAKKQTTGGLKWE